MIKKLNLLGNYGEDFKKMMGNDLPALSFRNSKFKNIKSWQKKAKDKYIELLSAPTIKKTPKVTVEDTWIYDGLQFEELSWQLPYGPKTKAYFIKLKDSNGKLPGLLALHDHSGNKYLGKEKIVDAGPARRHVLHEEHQDHAYEGVAFANKFAKEGYGVLVHDTFLFSSRMMTEDLVPDRQKGWYGKAPQEHTHEILKYNEWAGNYEDQIAKSIACSHYTWPGLYSFEDQIALDILAKRTDINQKNLGALGLSGGGLRTVMLGGLDARLKACLCIGFMSTWEDFMYQKSFIHTWMLYITAMPKYLDFPEILGLRVPLPTYVQSCREDPLYSLKGMKEACDILKEIYQKAGSPENFKSSFYSGGHKFDKAMQADAIKWLAQYLKA